MSEINSVRIKSDITIAMRDGVKLFGDVYLPDSDGPFPTIIQRTPYDKTSPLSNQMLDPIKTAKAGYAFVIQDTRGRYSSDGIFRPFVDEINDGYDTIEWAASQDWSTGYIGMCGASYVGATQWLAATSNPPHLVTIIPNVTASNYHNGWTYQGGAFELGFNVSWTMLQLTLANFRNLSRSYDISQEQRSSLIDAIDNMTLSFKELPLKQFPNLKSGLAEYFYEWLDHPSYDDFWRKLSIEDNHNKICIPALNIGGWYDIFLGGTISNYVGMTNHGASDKARQGQKLIIGPWQHGSRGSSIAGDQYFGIRADAMALGLDYIHLRWYDYWLKGIDNGILDEPKVKIFVMGDNLWRDENEWPIQRAENTRYYFHSNGKANTRLGDGYLDVNPPTDEPYDVYLYNPNDPVPTVGGPLCCNPYFVKNGAFDQGAIEDRSDILIYTTPQLDTDVEVTGPIAVSLWAITSALDTDFTAKLVDVCEDGCARNLTDGIIRARYRDSMSDPSLITPNEPTCYKIDLWATSNCFKKGHRIRIEISSSNFPRFDRNSNTGGEISEDKLLLPALQKVLHTSDYPSYITLPIVARIASNLE